MPNYGDVALNLAPNWSRRSENDQQLALRIIGHEAGVPDVCLKDDPEARHQFARVEPRYKDEIDINRVKGYEFVTEGQWMKNVPIWQWDANGHLDIAGQLVMARPEHLYVEELERRRRLRLSRKDKELDTARALAERNDIQFEEEAGSRVRRKRRTA